jgi:nucleotide-binding universal stress UspA family protein
MYRRILVPVDGSHTSTLGLQQAVRLAKNEKTQLRLVHVVDEFIITQDFGSFVNAGDLIDSLHDAGKKILRNALALTHRHGINAQGALYETMGLRVADVLLREAKKWKADLIVMGTHGRRGINRMMLGSDAETVLRTSSVPVLMVRSPGAARRSRKAAQRR